ncbi:hypothetical protein JM946_01510 [Steroidobacter sp. S1-65]|uniref:Uncharacterized protein n=1 Tax=Steroidobacter gossypii TaxID=2805490 RepID=A0ABS1WR00_9GAMM|nr:hypothetical protein [Steroidobacter gossypii]MBM0103397.1 hypothetical protein [Steroidobacter gossypii]
MPEAKTVNLDVHAVATLRYIRASMDAAGNVAVPGSAGIAMGIIGTAATVLCLVPHLRPHWLVIWLATGPIAAVTGGLLLARSGSVAYFIAAGTPGRKLAVALLPTLFAGAVLTAVLWRADLTDVIPGTWLLMYGCALISASVSTTSIVTWMGASFAGFGLLALVMPAPLQIPLLGIGFGGLHVLFGILIARGARGRES